LVELRAAKAIDPAPEAIDPLAPQPAATQGGLDEPQRVAILKDTVCPTIYDPAILEWFDVDFRRIGNGTGGGPTLEEVMAVRRLTGRAVVARAPCGGPFGRCIGKYGFETFFTELRRNERDAAAAVHAAAAEVARAYRRMLAEVGPAVDLVEVADDYAFTGGPLVSPEVFGRVVGPALATVIRTIHEAAPGARVLFHSCGSILPLLPALLDAGIDVLSPLDPTGRHMDPETVAERAGRLRTARGERLVLHGGLDPRLLTGSVGDIRREVRRYVSVLGRAGGYILAPSTDILEDVPATGLAALFEIAAEEARL